MPSPSEAKTGPESALGDGGPAFPGGYIVDQKDRGPVTIFAPGMSLRDWLAGQALVGLLANPDSPSAAWSADAINAYCAADAMLAERAKAVRS